MKIYNDNTIPLKLDTHFQIELINSYDEHVKVEFEFNGITEKTTLILHSNSKFYVDRFLSKNKKLIFSKINSDIVNEDYGKIRIKFYPILNRYSYQVYNIDDKFTTDKFTTGGIPHIFYQLTTSNSGIVGGDKSKQEYEETEGMLFSRTPRKTIEYQIVEHENYNCKSNNKTNSEKMVMAKNVRTYCVECGRRIKKGWNYCAGCGTKVN